MLRLLVVLAVLPAALAINLRTGSKELASVAQKTRLSASARLAIVKSTTATEADKADCVETAKKAIDETYSAVDAIQSTLGNIGDGSECELDQSSIDEAAKKLEERLVHAKQPATDVQNEIDALLNGDAPRCPVSLREFEAARASNTLPNVATSCPEYKGAVQRLAMLQKHLVQIQKRDEKIVAMLQESAQDAEMSARKAHMQCICSTEKRLNTAWAKHVEREKDDGPSRVKALLLENAIICAAENTEPGACDNLELTAEEKQKLTFKKPEMAPGVECKPIDETAAPETDDSGVVSNEDKPAEAVTGTEDTVGPAPAPGTPDMPEKMDGAQPPVEDPAKAELPAPVVAPPPPPAPTGPTDEEVAQKVAKAVQQALDEAQKKFDEEKKTAVETAVSEAEKTAEVEKTKAVEEALAKAAKKAEEDAQKNLDDAEQKIKDEANAEAEAAKRAAEAEADEAAKKAAADATKAAEEAAEKKAAEKDAEHQKALEAAAAAQEEAKAAAAKAASEADAAKKKLDEAEAASKAADAAAKEKLAKAVEEAKAGAEAEAAAEKEKLAAAAAAERATAEAKAKEAIEKARYEGLKSCQQDELDKQKAALEAAKKAAEEAERKKKAAEEAERKRKAAEEAAKKAAEEAAKKAAEEAAEEAAKKAAEEAARIKAQQEAAAKAAAQAQAAAAAAAAAKIKAQQEAAAKIKAQQAYTCDDPDFPVKNPKYGLCYKTDPGPSGRAAAGQACNPPGHNFGLEHYPRCAAPAAAKVSCRHKTYQDTTALKAQKMRSGSYCVDKTIQPDSNIEACETWTSGGGGFVSSPEPCPAQP